MKRSILIPCDGFFESDNHRYLMNLIFLDPAEYSPREQDIVEFAISMGEVYHGEIEYVEDGFKLTTDLGDPDTKVSMTFPDYVSLELASQAIGDAVNRLMNYEAVGLRKPFK